MADDDNQKLREVLTGHMMRWAKKLEETLSNLDKETEPLICAAETGHESCVEIFLDKGADVKTDITDCFTALISASQNGHIICMKLLINAGADVNQSYENYNTVLMLHP